MLAAALKKSREELKASSRQLVVERVGTVRSVMDFVGQTHKEEVAAISVREGQGAACSARHNGACLFLTSTSLSRSKRWTLWHHFLPEPQWSQETQEQIGTLRGRTSLHQRNLVRECLGRTRSAV